MDLENENSQECEEPQIFGKFTPDGVMITIFVTAILVLIFWVLSHN